MKRLALVAIVVGAVLVPATSASAAHRPAKLRLSLVPLQSAQLGPANASLALNYGSGPIHGYLVSDGLFGTLFLAGGVNLGGIKGYALNYGDPFTGSAGVTAISSSVEEYRTSAAAKKGLVNGRFEDSDFSSLSSPMLSITAKKVAATGVRGRRFAYLITLSAPNLNPIVRLDEQVKCGSFVLDLTVTAGTASAAESRAPRLLRVLVNRLRLLLEGRPAGTPATLPPKPRVGQAPGGPDLSTLALDPTDVGESGGTPFQSYTPALAPALSEYFQVIQPAGSYDFVAQQIGWWPTATEATYAATYQGALGVSFGVGDGGSFGVGSGETVTPVDLSALSDPATGYLITGDDGSDAVVTLTNGPTGEVILGKSTSTLQASDVQSLAQAAANRLDAGLP
jgi:hypothetical protein